MRVIGAGVDVVGVVGATVLDGGASLGTAVDVVDVVASTIVAATVIDAPLGALVPDVVTAAAGKDEVTAVDGDGAADVAVGVDVVAKGIVVVSAPDEPGGPATSGAVPAERDPLDSAAAATTTTMTMTTTSAGTTMIGRLAARHRLRCAATPPCCPLLRRRCAVRSVWLRFPWSDGPRKCRQRPWPDADDETPMTRYVPAPWDAWTARSC